MSSIACSFHPMRRIAHVFLPLTVAFLLAFSKHSEPFRFVSSDSTLVGLAAVAYEVVVVAGCGNADGVSSSTVCCDCGISCWAP